ncbi:ParB/RepB/Spo0J family partition protein [Nitrospirillum amazonense]|uniref:ParB/RepB/Spo0J family partition protein n=1 Tax=Nitrospirillum amazonense TaxID=28077 RepID=UPI0024127F8C|nr:ParB/RepB/Spo0J family partition protein [Nitrospirillum amazonense]MDG3444575.1 ParB/RepB/Spo0J family partition protein [Nitrospirillum amazonense]
MSKAATKIVLSQISNISLDKLQLSQSNVRRIKDGVSIEQLAEDIARRTLLQSLCVRPILDAEDQPTGFYDVPAGGRRFTALQLLVKQKRLAKNAPIPCIIREDGIAEEDSLAENTQRAPLHPLDQYRAFKALRDHGKSDEEIAAAFFTTAKAVGQRLRLVTVSETLLDAYGQDQLTLEQLMAFSVTDDHARQEQVWEEIKRNPGWGCQPYQIRHKLTEKSISSTDYRVKFLGLATYEAAGGAVTRDLFSQEDECFLTDTALVDRLIIERLDAESSALKTKGWKWVEAALSIPYSASYGLRQIQPTGEPDPTSLERLAQLEQQRDALVEGHPEYEDLPDDINEKLEEIEAAIAEIENEPATYTPAEMAMAGCFVSVSRDGELAISAGYVRPEDEPVLDAPTDADADGVSDTAKGDPTDPDTTNPTDLPTRAAPEPEEDDSGPAIPARLRAELSTSKTVALRNAVAQQPEVALTALLHRLVAKHFAGTPLACLEASVHETRFTAEPPNLDQSIAAIEITNRNLQWAQQVPTEKIALWNWLTNLSQADRLALLAHVVSYGINAIDEVTYSYGPYTSPLDQRLADADHLAAVANLDMATHWEPTTENYLARVTKSAIVTAVREGCGDERASLIEHLKKQQMAAEAQRLLSGTGWLPPQLRVTAANDDFVPAIATSDELPAFLEETICDDTPDNIQAIAAE